jgi:5-methylcytosine-specific restriction endonuclease McrA
VKRAVWERDGGRCTYVGEDGRRCNSAWQVEFDHRIEVGRGGEPTVDNVRLLCRPHNQYAAEQTYGAEFMASKRQDPAA